MTCFPHLWAGSDLPPKLRRLDELEPLDHPSPPFEQPATHHGRREGDHAKSNRDATSMQLAQHPVTRGVRRSPVSKNASAAPGASPLASNIATSSVAAAAQTYSASTLRHSHVGPSLAANAHVNGKPPSRHAGPSGDQTPSSYVAALSSRARRRSSEGGSNGRGTGG